MRPRRTHLSDSCVRIFPLSLVPDVVLYGAKREANDPRRLARLIGSGLFRNRKSPERSELSMKGRHYARVSHTCA